MKKIKRIITSCVALFMLTSFIGCDIIKRTPESIGKTVLAKVNGEKITRADVDEELYYTLNYYKSNYGEDFEENEEIKTTLKENRTTILENLIDEKVVMSKKDDLKVEYTDEEIQEEVDEQIKYFKDYYQDEDTYNEFLKAYGFNDKSFEEYWRHKIIVSKVVDAMVQDVTVSDEEVKKYYEDNIASYQINPGADVEHIVFTDTTTGKDDALAARELFLQGKTLEEIAEMDQFKDKCTVENLGHQDFENNSVLVSEFIEGFKDLPEGEISEPVETSYGWHLILTSNINTEVKTQSFEEVKDEITSTVLGNKKSEVYNEKLEKYKESMDIKIYEDRY